MKANIWWLGIGILLLVLVACGQPGSTRGVAGGSVMETSGASGAGTVKTEGTQTGGVSAQSGGGPVNDQVSFVDHLRGRGYKVEIAGAVEQPFLRVKGTTLRISGKGIQQPADVQSYNYDDTDLGTDGLKAAEEDAQQLGPDGNPRTSMITWVAPPHFFRKQRLIVLYVGDDAAVTTLLTDALGPQFAGR